MIGYEMRVGWGVWCKIYKKRERKEVEDEVSLNVLWKLRFLDLDLKKGKLFVRNGVEIVF